MGSDVLNTRVPLDFYCWKIFVTISFMNDFNFACLEKLFSLQPVHWFVELKFFPLFLILVSAWWILINFSILLKIESLKLMGMLIILKGCFRDNELLFQRQWRYITFQVTAYIMFHWTSKTSYISMWTDITCRCLQLLPQMLYCHLHPYTCTQF